MTGFTRAIFIDQEIGFVLARENTDQYYSPLLLKTIDGGNSWTTTRLRPPTVSGFVGFYPLTEKIIYATGSPFPFPNGSTDPVWTIYKSLDGGESWEAIEGDYHKTPGSIHFFDENNAFMFFNGPLLSSDGGRTWDRLPITDSTDFTWVRSALFTSRMVGYGFGGAYFDGVNFSLIMKTTDGGKTWDDISDNLSSHLSNVTDAFFLDDNVGFVFTVDYQFYRTIDGGTHWELTNSKLPILGTGSVFFSQTEGYMCGGVRAGDGSHSGIYFTSDGGKSWREEYSANDTPSFINNLSFPSPKVGYVTSHNYVLKKMKW